LARRIADVLALAVSSYAGGPREAQHDGAGNAPFFKLKEAILASCN
jgi:hypothetical protein